MIVTFENGSIFSEVKTVVFEKDCIFIDEKKFFNNSILTIRKEDN